MLLFDSSRDCALLCDPDRKELRLALKDLRRDLLYLSSKKDAFPIESAPARAGAVCVRIDPSVGGIEAWQIEVLSDRVLIVGSDVLGAVFGIYAFSTRLLGFSPSHRLTDLLPEKKSRLSLSPGFFCSPARPVRYRGWFLNDEDLLTDFVISGGRRNIDYRFYQNVMDVSVLERVLETALRLEINLVIPSSFVDLENPWEQALVEAATSRGMYVSQHHVEPVGVSYFAAADYIQKHGSPSESVSFVSNRARMEEIWRYYIKKWAQYGDRVVWQLGLRGKADVAVWKSDPTCPVSMRDRGAIISDAIATQHRIIREVLGTSDFPATVTLWHEGSVLYGQGHLSLPKDVTVIFSDFGADQTFGEDFYTIPRKDGTSYGIYYHAAYFPSGAHLAESCDPRKMAYFYREAWQNRSLSYSMLNVSNVRPLHFLLTLNAALLCDPMGFDPDGAARAFDRDCFGEKGDEVNALRRAYYASFADFGEPLIRQLCREWCFFYHEYPSLPFVRDPASDGSIVRQTKQALLGKWSLTPLVPALAQSERARAELLERMRALAETLCEDKRRYFEIFLQQQNEYFLHLTRWSLAVAALLSASCAEALSQSGSRAIAELDAILQLRRTEAKGYWEHWYRGDGKINVENLKERTLAAWEKRKEEM